MAQDPTRRFSTRVENYVRYRPGYPETLLPLLEKHRTLRPGDTVADLGFGTGKLTERFLERGYPVHAVEPNAEMREAGRRLLADDGCRVVAGRAEATGLPDDSVDLVAAAQAFHWFELEPTLDELARILRSGGRVALIWNVRDEHGDPFMAGYEALLEDCCTDYRDVGAHGVDEPTRKQLFGPGGGAFHRLSYEQRLDREGLVGRVLSASYAPEAGQPGHENLADAIGALFESHQANGEVTLRYRTEVYHGRFERG